MQVPRLEAAPARAAAHPRSRAHTAAAILAAAAATLAAVMGGSHDHTLLEEGCELMLDYRKIQKVATCGDDVVPVAVQDVDTREVLILAYANEFALAEARRRGVCVLWSTSRRKLWVKGETSGDYLDLKEVRVNCEQNSLLYLVKPRRTGACHTKDERGRSRVSCYYRALDGDGWLVKRPPPKRTGYSPEAVFGAFLLGALVATRTKLLFPR